MRAILAQLQIAFMVLTRLPVGRLRQGAENNVPSIAQTVWAFPIVGAVVGGLAALVLVLGLPAPLAAGVIIIASVLATGALHEDGLADMADGFGGGRTPARKLEIMRDSRIGSYGALALITALGLRAAALMLMIQQGGTPQTALALIAIEAGSRAGLPAILRWVPAARSDGLGQSAAGVSAMGAFAALMLGAGALLLLGVGPALMVGGAMALVCLGLSRLAIVQIGGQTGDVLGAVQQICALIGWLVLLG